MTKGGKRVTPILKNGSPNGFNFVQNVALGGEHVTLIDNAGNEIIIGGGGGEIDLTNYYTKTESDSIFEEISDIYDADLPTFWLTTETILNFTDFAVPELAPNGHFTLSTSANQFTINSSGWYRIGFFTTASHSNAANTNLTVRLKQNTISHTFTATLSGANNSTMSYGREKLFYFTAGDLISLTTQANQANTTNGRCQFTIESVRIDN